MNSTRSRDLRARAAAVTTETRILLGLSLALVVLVLVNDFGVLTPDTKPEIFLQPAQTAARFASSWLDTPNLGTSNYNAGVVPVAALFSLVDLLGVPAWVIMRLWRIGLLLLAAWGARLLVRDLLVSRDGSASVSVARPGPGVAAAGVAAAVAYAANPYVIVGGGTTPTLLPYALLPWLVLCWVRGFRSPSWRWAAAAALVLAAMSGLNAGVVPLLQLAVVVPVLVHALVVEGHRFATVAWLVVRTGLLYVVLSAYWLVPAIAALGVGTSIAEATETTGAINTVNSFPEVLRGLGMWTLYGASSSGLFDPQRISYVTAPVVVLLSFGGPLLAALGVRFSRSPVRLFAATAVLTGALIMVGTFPNASPSAWGRAVGAALENVPGLIAFRTTNKAGAVLELGLAVLVGLAAHALVPRLRTSTHRWLAWGTATAIVAGSVAPALSGDMFWVRMDLPRYWQQAAQQVNAQPGDSRVLMVPGTGVPAYSWGYEGPDEIGPSLFRRPFAFRSASPSGGPYSANLLAEVDRRLHQGTAPAGTVSALADYIGAGDVVGRYDVQGTGSIGARVEEQLEADRGLGPAQAFGPRESAHGAPAPAVVRQVVGEVRRTSAGARPAAGALVVDGAGSSFPSLQAAGLLEDRPGVLLAGALSEEQLADALRDRARVVLTDGNGRREWSNQNPAVAGGLLPALTEPAATRALFGAADQTISALRGNATVQVRQDDAPSGSASDSVGDPHLAFDGDRTTGWQFGGFGTGTGHELVLTPRSPVAMPLITLAAMQNASSRITTARVTAQVGGTTVVKDVSFTEWNSFPVSVELSPEPVSSVTVEVTGVAGGGAAPVGFSEIVVPGVGVAEVGAMPQAFARRLAASAAKAGVDLGEVPIDVVMHRNLGDANGLSADEARLEREFTLPDDRELEMSGTVRLAAGAADAEIDALAGQDGPVVAQSSSRALNSPAARASMALDTVGGDADRSTAWSPGGPVVGEWISVDFPQRRLASFTFTQGVSTSYATRALVSVDDGEPFETTLAEGTTRIVLPEVVEDATRVRVLITDRFGTGFVRVTDIGLPHVATASKPTGGCTRIGMLDGTPIEADLSADFARLLAGESVDFRACAPSSSLEAGRHRVSGLPAFSIDDLRLSSAAQTAVTAAPPTVQVVRHSAAAMDLRLVGGCSPCLVSSGQAFDERWTADVGGRELGKPVVVDGYAAGWRVDADPGAVVHIEFGPSRTGLVAWLVSALGLLVALALVALGRSQPRAAVAARSAASADSTVAPPVAPARRTLGLAAEVGLWVAAVAAVWGTVGWVPAVVVASLVVVQRVVRPASKVLANVAVGLMATIPAVWFLGSSLPLSPPAIRLNDNLVAHQWGGLSIWVLFLAACVETMLRESESE